jgi:nucleotide-binding universal stress UspA family protein
MYRKILVGYDGTGHGRDALALGKLLAETQGGRLVIAGVVAEDPDYADLAREVEWAAQEVAGAVEIIAGRSPARALKELGEEIRADLIVLGSSVHGRLGGVKLGRTGRSLFQGAPCAVALAPTGFRGADAGLRVIGVGVDGSEESREALAAAIELGRAPRAP